jgi:hypothetical protein
MALFSSYDSAEFPLIEQSIEHSTTNPFIFNNYSNRMIAVRDSENIIVNEPYNILQEMIDMLSEHFVEYDMPENEYYMPERTAKKIYDSHDFWYICMLVNKCVTIKDYHYTKYFILPADKLFHIETFLDKVKNEVRMYQPDLYTVFK